MRGNRGDCVLSIGPFSVFGCLRVALEPSGHDVTGHISIEKGLCVRRVVEHLFPGAIHRPDIVKVEDSDVESCALMFGQVEMVMLGAGQPCQGVSGVASQRKGARGEEGFSLFTRVKRLQALVQRNFPWAQVQTLKKRVASMGKVDKIIISFGETP